MQAIGNVQHVRVSGYMACFTQPALRMERVSNVVPAAAAWDGILSCVMGHKGARYHIEQAALLFEPRRQTITSNEISDFSTWKRTLRTSSVIAGNRRTIRKRGYDDEIVETVTAGVDYIVSFRLVAPDSEFDKLDEMLARRLSNGHHRHPAYLGSSDHRATVMPVESFTDVEYPIDMPLVEHGNGLKTADYSERLGNCFYGIDWEDQRHEHPYYFAPLDVKRGIVRYPSWDEVRKLGIWRTSNRSCGKECPRCRH